MRDKLILTSNFKHTNFRIIQETLYLHKENE